MTEHRLAETARLIEQRMGLYFPPERYRDLMRGLDLAAAELGWPSGPCCAQALLNADLDRQQIEILAGALTVGETYFFRDPASYEALEKCILPALIQERRGKDQRLRIWSAACCTGEEPYSIAICLHRCIPDLHAWDVTLLATDINPRFLQKAEQGRYTEWSFRSAPARLRKAYFRPKRNKQYEVSPEIRRMVTFSYLNLADDVYPSVLNNTNAMDVIFCRNVMIYFAQDRIGQVAARMRRALVDGGWLIVSPTEASHIHFSEFSTVTLSGAIAYRKHGAAPHPAPSPSRPKAPSRTSTTSPPSRPKAPSRAAAADTTPRPAEPRPVAPDRVALDASAAWSDQAHALLAAGRYREVCDLASDRAEAGHDDPATSALAARAAANLGDLEAALSWCEKALAKDKMRPELHYLHACVFLAQNLPDGAAQALRRCLYLDPDFVIAHFALGNLSRRLGDQRSGARHFRNVLALTRNRPKDEILPESAGMSVESLEALVSVLTSDRTARAA